MSDDIRFDNEAFRSAETRVAGYNDLTAEHGRALYAGYVQRGVEIDRLREQLAQVEHWRGFYQDAAAKRGEEHRQHLEDKLQLKDKIARLEKERDAARAEREQMRQEWNRTATFSNVEFLKMDAALREARAEAGRMREILTSAQHALRSYQYGNVSPDLAESVADAIGKVLSPSGGGEHLQKACNRSKSISRNREA